MSKFAQGRTSGKIEFTYRYNKDKTIAISSSKTVIQVSLPLSKAQKTGHMAVTNKGQGVLFTRIIMTGIPEAGNEASV